MAATSEALWRLLPDVRAHERRRFLFFASLSGLVSMAQTLGLVGAESLFLARFGAERLPEPFIAASLLTVAGSIAYAAVVGNTRNDDLFVAMLLGVVLWLVGASFGLSWNLRWVLPALYCLYYLLQAVFVNHLYTFAVDYFDSAASKRLFPLFTISASIGGTLGGALGAAVAGGLGPIYLIPGWALLYAVCMVLLRLFRRPLRRWGPLALEEADETSVEGIQGALRYLRSSRLGRWLVLSALGMVVSLFVAQYLYSAIFVEAFPDPETLAAFLGLYLAVTNAVEIGLGFLLTPWLIRRYGVASANLLHPTLTALSFAALAFRPGLVSASLARMNRELVDNATGFPIRTLVYNAMPMRLRGRMRAFLEGIVVYAGMSGAGLLLLLVGRPDPLWLCAAGAAAALVFLGANVAVRRAYLRALVGQLRTGSLDLADIGDEIGSWEAQRLADLWQSMVRDETGRPSRPLLEMIPNLARRGIVEPLLRETRHPSPEVRRSCLLALAPLPGEAIDEALVAGMQDSVPAVRLAALRGAARRPRPSSRLDLCARRLVEDPAPEVRAEAASRAGAAGLAVLREMATSSDGATATSALRAAPAGILAEALARVGDPSPAIRAAALEAASRMSQEPPFEEAELARLARDPHPAVRRAALLLLANLESDKTRMALAGALADESSEVAATAETLLGALGEEGVEIAASQLHSENERAVEAALRVLAAAGSRELLYTTLRERVRELWALVFSFQKLPPPDSIAARFLRMAYEDAMLRCRRLAFRNLELLTERSIIRKVDRMLRAASSRSRGDALEVLSNLGDREAAQLLVLLHDHGPLRDKQRSLERWISLPGSTELVLEASLRSEHRFVRLGARALVADVDGPLLEEEVMERLLAMKEVPLFSQLSLEQLEAVLRITEEREYLAGELIFREGDPGGKLYLLIEGTVQVYKSFGEPGEQLLSTLPAITYFGEMAILDDAPRSASVVAGTASRVLTLGGGDLKELIVHMPEISFEIFRILTLRVRSAEARLSAVAQGGSDA